MEVVEKVASKQKSWAMSGIVLAFLVPFILAWLVLKMGWFERGVLSHGQWLEQPVQVQGYPIGKWGIVQVSNQACEQSCQGQLNLLERSWVALGSAQADSRIFLMGQQPSEAPAAVRQLAADASFAQWEQQWLVVDPKGWAILSYQPEQGSEHIKGMLSDLKRLIKNSRFK